MEEDKEFVNIIFKTNALEITFENRDVRAERAYGYEYVFLEQTIHVLHERPIYPAIIRLMPSALSPKPFAPCSMRDAICRYFPIPHSHFPPGRRPQ